MKKIFPVLCLLWFSFALGQSYDLRLNLKTGETYETMQVLQINMNQLTEGQKTNMFVSASVGMTAKVIAKEKDIYRLEVQYTYLDTFVKTGGNSISYNSNMSADNEFVRGLREMINYKFRISLTDLGKVVAVEGNKDIISHIKSNFGHNQLIAEGKLVEIYNTETIRQTFEAVHPFPARPVKPGDVWEQEFLSEDQYKMVNQARYKLEKADEQFYVISFVINRSTDPNLVMAMEDMSFRSDLKGHNKGTLKLDRQTGWIINYDSAGTTRGIVSIVSPVEMKSEMEIESKINYYPQSEPKSPPPPMRAK